MKQICLLSLLLFLSCGKSITDQKLIVLEYPSLQPLQNVSVELFECKILNCSNPELLGVFKTNANGEVIYETTIAGIHHRTFSKTGYAITEIVDKSLEDAFVFFMAKQSWVHVDISNGLPLAGSDSCYAFLYQRDSLLLTDNLFQGILHDGPNINAMSFFLNSIYSTSSAYTVPVAGDVYASFEATIIRNGMRRDTVIPILCPPGDTAFVNFVY